MARRPLRDMSIKRKLMLIVMLTSSVALLLACAAFVTYELITFRRTMVRHVSTLADIVGTNCTAALTFDDRRAAEETLAALRAEQHIVSASIYTRDGKVFARYRRGARLEDWAPPMPQEDGHAFGEDHLDLFRRIVLDGEMIGIVYLQSDLREMHARLQRYVGIVAIVMGASSLVAFALSSKLRRVISAPILHLAATTRVVSVDKNYAVRAVKQSHDELGMLIEAFNDMLTRIQERDAALQEAHDRLEARVEERTQELRQEVFERRRAEEALRQLNEELEQRVLQRTAQLTAANRELEAFSYSVSHDLRAPLRSIDGFSQALLEDYAPRLDGPGKDYLQRVCAASRRMAELIDDLLNLSRVTRSEMRQERVDLSALTRAIVAELQQAHPERQVECVIAAGAVVNGDAPLLRVVLENLLGNAWKFTQKQPQARIEFGVTQHDGTPVYFVRDNGAGFDMAYADKLFGAFQRLHARTEFEGTGIGLATVQRIIHRHGGRIWAQGAVEHGATFYFTL